MLDVTWQIGFGSTAFVQAPVVRPTPPTPPAPADARTFLDFVERALEAPLPSAPEPLAPAPAAPETAWSYALSGAPGRGVLSSGPGPNGATAAGPAVAPAPPPAMAAAGAPASGARPAERAERTERVERPSSAGALTASGAPVELSRHGNGRIPRSALEPIGHGSHRLWAPAAAAFRDLHAAAARDGVRLGVTDSYRSYEQQVDVARRKGLYSQGGLAARPGTSDHGWGRSLDLDLDRKALAWMRRHARDHGFVEDVPREPWHWTYSPSD